MENIGSSSRVRRKCKYRIVFVPEYGSVIRIVRVCKRRRSAAIPDRLARRKTPRIMRGGSAARLTNSVSRSTNSVPESATFVSRATGGGRHESHQRSVAAVASPTVSVGPVKPGPPAATYPWLAPD